MSIKRISAEKAEGLIKVSQDNDDVAYYTITPHVNPQKASEGWESVTYYSNKKQTYQIPTNVPNAQWVYALSNPSMPNMLKIGYTNQDPEDRVKEINRATGVPTDFIVEYAFPCVNGYEVEQLVHDKLDELRVNGKKEFFHVPLDRAKEVINEVGNQYEIKE